MRRIVILVWALCLPLAVATHSAWAEGMADQDYTKVLLDLNRIRAGQNPALSLGHNQLNARILDKNQRTIGKVEDIIVAPDGSFQTLTTNIETSGFREEVAFDVKSYVVTPTPDTFTVSLDKAQLKQNAAKLIAAAGLHDDALFSIRSLQGAEIHKTDGVLVARVKDVLIDNRKLQIVSLLVVTMTGDNRGAALAIPYEAEQAVHNGAHAALTVTDAQAAIIVSMATKR